MSTGDFDTFRREQGLSGLRVYQQVSVVEQNASSPELQANGVVSSEDDEDPHSRSWTVSEDSSHSDDDQPDDTTAGLQAAVEVESPPDERRLP